MTCKHGVLIGLALFWFALDLWIVTRNVILRETILAPVARWLDGLPNGMNQFSFLVLWILVLFGWIVPLSAGLEPLLLRGQ